MNYNPQHTQRSRGPFRHPGDEKLHIAFSTEAVQSDFKTKAEGRPVFDDVEMLEIRIPMDDTNIIKRLVSDEDRERFPDEYEAFKTNTTLATSGTPLEHWSALTKSQVAALKYAGVVSVDDLVGASDANIKNIMGGMELREKARAFLNSAHDTALVEKQASEINELREAIKALQVQALSATPANTEAVSDSKKSK